MTRKENIRRLCYEIDFMVDFAVKEIEYQHYNNAQGIIKSIRKRTLKLKRTTYRGDK